MQSIAWLTPTDCSRPTSHKHVAATRKRNEIFSDLGPCPGSRLPPAGWVWPRTQAKDVRPWSWAHFVSHMKMQTELRGPGPCAPHPQFCQSQENANGVRGPGPCGPHPPFCQSHDNANGVWGSGPCTPIPSSSPITGTYKRS